MQKKLFSRLLFGTLALTAMTSCGGDKAGGTGEFATVFAVAGGPSGQLDSDVAVWVDATGAPADQCGVNSFITVAPDTVNYTITSSPYTAPNTGQTTTIAPSQLVLNRVTLTLTPADTLSPALPARYAVQNPSSSASVIPVNTPVTVPVRIADNDFKVFLLTGLGAQTISCSNFATYSYRAVVSFELLEVNTNRVSTITASGFLVVKFSDFQDE